MRTADRSIVAAEISPTMRRWIDDYAREKRKTNSWVLREALTDFIANKSRVKAVNDGVEEGLRDE